jgi:hypothetical protein
MVVSHLENPENLPKTKHGVKTVDLLVVEQFSMILVPLHDKDVEDLF